MQKTNILKESGPKNVVLMKTKNKTFLTFLDKMPYSAILFLATYDLFCADGSQMVCPSCILWNTYISVHFCTILPCPCPVRFYRTRPVREQHRLTIRPFKLVGPVQSIQAYPRVESL